MTTLIVEFLLVAELVGYGMVEGVLSALRITYIHQRRIGRNKIPKKMMVASLCDSWCEIDWRMLSQVFVSVILVNEMY